MTSINRISAHCSDDKVVVVKISDYATGEVLEKTVLRNGESKEVLMYDDRTVLTFERLKRDTDFPEVPAVE